MLEPGEEKVFFVCTDGGETRDDPKGCDAARAIDAHHGKLLWRVHLRRGVEVVNAHRYVPLSTVFGVEFTDETTAKVVNAAHGRPAAWFFSPKNPCGGHHPPCPCVYSRIRLNPYSDDE